MQDYLDCYRSLVRKVLEADIGGSASVGDK